MAATLAAAGLPNKCLVGKIRTAMSRAKLLSVSARLFAQNGFEATSMRDIAKRAGMLAGSMYYHFPSKNELIAAVYEAGVTQIGMAVDAALAGATEPWARLEVACI